MVLHLNTTQDLGHGLTVIFICCVFIIASVLIDLDTGVRAARRNKEKIQSRILRHTITKMLDYLRVLVFGVMIDVLGLSFVWYAIPYCAMLITVGVVCIEGKSVIENYKKSKSAARELPNVLAEIISCVNSEDAEKIVKMIKSNEYHKNNDKRLSE